MQRSDINININWTELRGASKKNNRRKRDEQIKLLAICWGCTATDECVWALHAAMNKTILFFSIIALWTFSHNGFNCQTTPTNNNRNHNNSQHSNRINRQRGNILRNLTRTHAYEDNIVTSQLDASERVRQFYRSIRDIYNRYAKIMETLLITHGYHASSV